jgi:hypothetical protein
VRPLAADPCLLDLQRATATRICQFRHMPVESSLLAQRYPVAAPLFSTDSEGTADSSNCFESAPTFGSTYFPVSHRCRLRGSPYLFARSAFTSDHEWQIY